MSNLIKVAIIGISGYVGQELMNLVLQHPQLRLAAVFARKASPELYLEIPLLEENKIPIFDLAYLENHLQDIDVFLLATPVELSMALVPQLAAAEKIVIDLSGAYRLSAKDFNEWYGLPHEGTHLLPEMNYGLSPWWAAKPIKKDQTLVSNPGCFATCALMAILPLIQEKIIDENDIILDGKSGVSGAGKNPISELLYCEIAENFFPYKIGKHQHTPEIKKCLQELTQQTCQVVLTTHLLPLIRGLSMTIYAKAKNKESCDSEIGAAIQKAYINAYANYPLVKFEWIGENTTRKSSYILNLKNVIKTPFTHIGYHVQQGKITLISSIDNLLKGAASQAIENLNHILGLPVHRGLGMKEEWS